MRLLRWQTLLGLRLSDLKIAPILLWISALVALVPSLLALAGLDLGLDLEAATTAFAHGLLEWTAAVLALVIAGFALTYCLTERQPEAMILASVLPVVAWLDAVHAFGIFSTTAVDDEAMLWLWWVSRMHMAFAFLVGGVVAFFRSEKPGRALAIVATGLGLGAVAAAVAFLKPAGASPQMLHETNPFLPRPWELVPLGLFVLAGVIVFPELHRQKPTVLSHALTLSTLAQVAVQLEVALGSLHPYDSHFMAAHLGKVAVYATLLLGIVLDYVHVQRSRENAMSNFESARDELRTKTEELVRVDQELTDQEGKRREAERSLKMLEKAVETMSLGVTISGPEGKILYTNLADARMHGYTLEELMGQNASIFSSVGSPPSENSDSIFLHPWTRERTNITKDGRIFPVRLVSDMVRDDENRPLGLVTLCEDISERKRIEAALERRDRILEAVGLAAERFLAETPWEASVEEVLESLRKATGVRRIHLGRVEVPRVLQGGLDDTWTTLAARQMAPLGIEHGEDLLFPRWERQLRQGRLVQGRTRDLPAPEREALESRGVHSFAVVPIFVSTVWLGYLYLEDDDKDREFSLAELEVLRTAARTFGAAMHRKQAQAALAASQAKYQDLIESTSDLVQSVSPEGRFQFVNRAWKEALGYREKEVAQMTLWDVVREDQHERLSEILDKVSQGESVDRLEVIFVTKDGSEIYVEGNLNCRFVDGKPVATRGIFRDISERKIVDRMKTEFISTVSHELRTPLTSIIASLGLLQSGRLAGNPERVHELVSVAHRNSNRLHQLINDLLDVQKLAAGKIVYRLTDIGVRELLTETVRGIQALADSFKIDIHIEEVSEKLRIMADRDRLIQVLNNLLSNAIKFSCEGEGVTVSANRRDDWVQISVADHGPGIPEEFQACLFEQFTQVDSTATRSAGGSGLGLSIVKGLMNGMQGKISLNTQLGEGTTFYIELPVPAVSGDTAEVETQIFTE